MKLIFVSGIVFLAMSCTQQPEYQTDYQSAIKSLSDSRFLAEQNANISAFVKLMSDSIISMPEYQPTLTGIDQVSAYYSEIFRRQVISRYDHEIEEIIDLDDTQVEFGTFHKEYRDVSTDSVTMLEGKYCHVWTADDQGNLKLAGEGFGFFHKVKNEKSFFVNIPADLKAVRATIAPERTPLVLRAYNVLMEKYVSGGKGALRSTFFAEDGRFMPFAHATLNTMAEIKPYLIEYDTHGPDFKMDTISVYTFHYETHGDYILEYPRFYVLWSTPVRRGGAEGKSLRLWKYQPAERSFKLYREIAFHDYLR
jgi:ketosteroid isomerase-like protein